MICTSANAGGLQITDGAILREPKGLQGDYSSSGATASYTQRQQNIHVSRRDECRCDAACLGIGFGKPTEGAYISPLKRYWTSGVRLTGLAEHRIPGSPAGIH